MATATWLAGRPSNIVITSYSIHYTKLYELPALCEQVSRASGRIIHGQKSLVGEFVFTHESGVHVDGILKDPRNYQGVDPARLGRQHKLVLGKHSGRNAVCSVFATLGYELAIEQADQLLTYIRHFAECTKRNPTELELHSVYREVCGLPNNLSA